MHIYALVNWGMLRTPLSNVNIGSGNGLVLVGNKLLPEPMLEQIPVII